MTSVLSSAELEGIHRTRLRRQSDQFGGWSVESLGKRGNLDSPPIQFMSTWEDPFHPDVPIDIDRTAVAVMLAVEVAVREEYGTYGLSNKAKAYIIDRVRELLATYDDIRSKHIAYLRDEVLRLHNLLPGATISVRNPDGNRSKST